MFLTKKHLSRRTVLKGAGVSLALPLLDAMIPAATALAQTAAAPKLRVGFFYIPHGAIQWNTAYGPAMDRWTPSGSGADFKLSEILSPLEELKHLVTSFSHLENKANENSVHSIVPATWLSGMRPDSRVARREHVDDDRPDDRRSTSARRRRCRRSRSPPRRRRRSPPARRAPAATTRRRCRSATPRRRCRWSSTRARCSRSCSAKATRTPSAPRSPRRRAACSI